MSSVSHASARSDHDFTKQNDDHDDEHGNDNVDDDHQSNPTHADLDNVNNHGNHQSTPHSDLDITHPLPPAHLASGLQSSLTSYGDPHFSLFLRRAFLSALGYSPQSLSLPLIGIITTYSALNPCHANIPQLIEAVKRGIQTSIPSTSGITGDGGGGLAVEFPTISLHESFASPTSMFLRNLMAMDTEEMIRAQPVDAVVMIGGCDKTVPAQLMGAISAGKPVVPLVTGPMMSGRHRGTRVGACSDCRGYWALYREGKIDVQEIEEVCVELAPTAGTCGVMGTASTMACVLVGLGLVEDLRGGATGPAVSSARLRTGEEAGRRAVELVRRRKQSQDQRVNSEGVMNQNQNQNQNQSQIQNENQNQNHHQRHNNTKTTPTQILTESSFRNAITVLQAVGGSTNAVVHLLAIANRHSDLINKITLDTVDEIGRTTPLLVDLKPSGEGYMTDFHDAGGMLALLHRLRPLLYLNAMTISGKTLGEVLNDTPFRTFEYSEQIVRPLDRPLYPASSLVVLRGNLCPEGAVMKASASKDRSLLNHKGRALVFDGTADMAERIDRDDLDVCHNTVLVLTGIGPVGNPGMPEAGMIPIPRRLARQGVRDMLRISDGRMSGTAGGTVVLHVSPEAADLGSVFGIVRTGDVIECCVEDRRLEVMLSPHEIAARVEQRKKMAGKQRQKKEPWLERSRRRGYRGLYERQVNQAHLGCDFDFLTAAGPAP